MGMMGAKEYKIESGYPIRICKDIDSGNPIKMYDGKSYVIDKNNLNVKKFLKSVSDDDQISLDKLIKQNNRYSELLHTNNGNSFRWNEIDKLLILWVKRCLEQN